MPSHLPRCLVMLLTLAVAWFALASGSLSAGQPEAQFAFATDEQSQEPDLSLPEPSKAIPSNQGSGQSPCFVAAPMASLTVDVSLPTGLLPDNVAANCTTTTASDSRIHDGWALTVHPWSATCQRHRPLYFEEANAERYGYTPSYCLQPLISAGHFFLTLPALPYKMAVDRPRDCEYTLGHHRPGSCGPWRWQRLPHHAGGTLAEAGMIAGLILLIP